MDDQVGMTRHQIEECDWITDPDVREGLLATYDDGSIVRVGKDHAHVPPRFCAIETAAGVAHWANGHNWNEAAKLALAKHEANRPAEVTDTDA